MYRGLIQLFVPHFVCSNKSTIFRCWAWKALSSCLEVQKWKTSLSGVLSWVGLQSIEALRLRLSMTSEGRGKSQIGIVNSNMATK
jgi:hypothetical protein